MYKKYFSLMFMCLYGCVCVDGFCRTLSEKEVDSGVETVVSMDVEPSRIVSLGVCTDQLLLILAERHRIASVTFLASSAEISMMADVIGDIPLNHGQAEEVISLAPDLILAGFYGARVTVNLLRRLGYKVLQVEAAQNFNDIRENLRLVGKAINRSGKAEEEIAAMDSKLRSAATAYPNTFSAKAGSADMETRKIFTNYDVNGFVAGKNTLFAAVAHRSGYQTLGDRLNFTGYRQVHLEQLLSVRPDLLDLGYKWPDPPSLATASLAHPALIKLVSKIDSVDFPGAAWTCGLPFLADMVAQLQDRKLRHSQIPEPLLQERQSISRQVR